MFWYLSASPEWVRTDWTDFFLVGIEVFSAGLAVDARYQIGAAARYLEIPPAVKSPLQMPCTNPAPVPTRNLTIGNFTLAGISDAAVCVMGLVNTRLMEMISK